MRLLFLVFGVGGLVVGCYLVIGLLSDRFMSLAAKGGIFDDASSVTAYQLILFVGLLLGICGLGSICFGVGM